MVITELDNKFYEMDYYKDYIREFIPNIDKIHFTKRQDRLIQKALLKRIIAVNKQIEDKGLFHAETCIFDIIFDAKDGDNKSQIAHLEWLNEQFGALMDLLDQKLWKKFEKTLLPLFIDFDDSGSRYLSRVGEIGFLKRTLEINNVFIKDIEFKLKNGKSIDFLLKFPFYDNFKLIEIVSIDLNINKIKNADELRNFLDRRLAEKIQDKSHGLEKIPFLLVPILWIENLNKLEKYKEAFSIFDEFNNLVLPPFGLYHLTTTNGDIKCAFEPISNMIEKFSMMNFNSPTI